MTSFHVIRIRLELELNPYVIVYTYSQISKKKWAKPCIWMGQTMYLEAQKPVFLPSGLLRLGCAKVMFGKKKAPGLGTKMDR
jgi:hypothetical protein